MLSLQFNELNEEMDKRLRPPIFDADASNSESSSKWKHWKKIFESYVRRIADITGQDKLDMLVSLLDTSVYVHISESQSYEEAIRLLDGAYQGRIQDSPLGGTQFLKKCKLFLLEAGVGGPGAEPPAAGGKG